MARRFPGTNGRVSEDLVRSIGPSNIKQLRVDRVLPIRLKQNLPGAGMDGRFFSGDGGTRLFKLGSSQASVGHAFELTELLLQGGARGDPGG